MSKPKTQSNFDIPESLMVELLTPSELRMLSNRWRILGMLKDGLPIRHIASVAKVGTDTVVRMSKKLKFSSRLRSYFYRIKPSDLNSSKWVFGELGKKEL